MKNQFQQPAPVKAEYQRYPLVMHRGEYPNIQSRHAHSAEDEAEAVAAGWGTARPAMPEPEPEKPVLTLEERVAALEAIVHAPRRGPGRPKGNANE